MILDHPLGQPTDLFPPPDGPRPRSGCRCRERGRIGLLTSGRHCVSGIVVHFHGNGELASEYTRRHAGLFLDMGVSVCFVDYRGYGRSTGTPALAAMRGDGERVVRALGVDPGKVVTFGRSLGSLYAIELADRLPGIAGVVIESGIADVGEPQILRGRLRPCGRVGSTASSGTRVRVRPSAKVERSPRCLTGTARRTRSVSGALPCRAVARLGRRIGQAAGDLSLRGPQHDLVCQLRSTSARSAEFLERGRGWRNPRGA